MVSRLCKLCKTGEKAIEQVMRHTHLTSTNGPIGR
jgi:hypothetical protein